MTTNIELFKVGDIVTVIDCFMMVEHECVINKIIQFDNTLYYLLKNNNRFSLGHLRYQVINSQIVISIRSLTWHDSEEKTLKNMEDQHIHHCKVITERLN